MTKGERRGSGKATIGDAISETMRKKMTELERALRDKARAAISMQLSTKQAAWFVDPRITARLTNSKKVAVSHAKPQRPRFADRSDVTKRWEPGPSKVSNSTKEPRVTDTEADERVQETGKVEFWQLPPNAKVKEPPPESIDGDAKIAFEETCRNGMGSGADRSGDPLFAFIGLDFGTSSTKVIVQFPYEQDTPCYAIDAPPHCRSGGNQHLWQTVCWFGTDETLLAWPEADAKVIVSLKQSVVTGCERDNAVSSTGEALAITRETATVGYLAHVIRYTRGWMYRNHEDLFRNRKPVWFVNVGLPAAYHDDPVISKVYRRIVAAALALANTDMQIRKSEIEAVLGQPEIGAAENDVKKGFELGIAVTPEVAAEIAGFSQSMGRKDELYVMVDVGAMTLDVCTFRLVGQKLQDRYSLLAAQVRPLGADAFSWFEAFGKTLEGFKNQCDLTLRLPIWLTRKTRDPHAKAFSINHTLPVFLAGGGAANPVHRSRVEALGPWLKQHVGNEGIIINELPVPPVLARQGLSDISRLAVAYGLSFPPNEHSIIVLPSEIEDLGPMMKRDHEAMFVSKELV